MKKLNPETQEEINTIGFEKETVAEVAPVEQDLNKELYDHLFVYFQTQDIHLGLSVKMAKDLSKTIRLL